MKDLREFNIAFAGLKLGKHKFEYQIDNKFFNFFNYDEFKSSSINIDLLFEKKSTMFQLEFKATGNVEVNCDLTDELFKLNIEGSLPLIVKFGEEYNNDNEEILIIPHGDFELNIAQYIYEMVVLSLPARRIHPGVEDGTLESDVLKKLEEYKEDKNKIDPRWEKLRQLQTNKNKE